MTRWVNCKEAMPTESRPPMLAWDGQTKHVIPIYDEQLGFWYTRFEFGKKQQRLFITHWMPFPRKPGKSGRQNLIRLRKIPRKIINSKQTTKRIL